MRDFWAAALLCNRTPGVVPRARVQNTRLHRAAPVQTRDPRAWRDRGMSRDPGLTSRCPDPRTGRRRPGSSATIGPRHRFGIPLLTDRMRNLDPGRQNVLLSELITLRVIRVPPLVPGVAIKADARMLELRPHALPRRAPRRPDLSEHRPLGEAPGPLARAAVLRRPDGATAETRRGAEGQSAEE